MGIITRLFGRSDSIIELLGNSGFDFEVVGESHYQSDLERIAGGRSDESAEVFCNAYLVPEPYNPHDKNAVAIKIYDSIVGYLSRDDAEVFIYELKSAGYPSSTRVRVKAVIVGGWLRQNSQGSFGVKLDVKIPLIFQRS
jgi:hypothetical protein